MNQKKRTAYLCTKNQQGLAGGIPEAVIGLTVAGGLMAGLAVMSNKSADDIRIQNAAYQMRQLRDATELYVRQNYQALSTAGATQNIALGTLRGQILPNSFPDNNPFNQAYGVRIADSNGAVAGGNLTILTYTVPTADSSILSPEQAAKAASLSGPEGGFVASNTADWSAAGGGVCTIAGNCAIGSFGGWRIDDLNANFGVTPGAGALASTGFVSEAAMASDALYRTNIGLPLANTMTTTMYGGTVGDINANGSIDANEVGASRGNGYTFDPNAGTYQMGGQLTVGAFDTNADGINDTFGANTTNNQGITMTTAGVLDARSRIASPVFDNNGAAITITSTADNANLSLAATGANAVVNINANAGTIISAGTDGNSALTISAINRPTGSNIWFSGGPGQYGDLAFDGGNDQDFNFTHIDVNGTTTFMGAATQIMRFYNNDSTVEITNGPLQSKIRTASPIFDNNGDSLAINAANTGSTINMFADQGTIFSTNGASAITIRNDTASPCGNTYFGGSNGDMAYDGGCDRIYTFTNINNDGGSQFLRGDGTQLLTMDNTSASLSIPNGSLWIKNNLTVDSGSIRVNNDGDIRTSTGDIWADNGGNIGAEHGLLYSRNGVMTEGGYVGRWGPYWPVAGNFCRMVDIGEGWTRMICNDDGTADLNASTITANTGIIGPNAKFVPGGTCRAVDIGGGYSEIQCN